MRKPQTTACANNSHVITMKEANKPLPQGNLPVKKNGNLKDLTGQIFGRWSVIREFGRKFGAATWLCKCDCGTIKEVMSRSLVKGMSRSCGCLRDEISSRKNSKHGLAKGGKFPEYNAWYDMISRCEKPTMPYYHRYGARGITVCERWRNSFRDFIADMGKRPSSKHSIDRIDNDGNYEPSNCRWATREEQNNNRSCCVYLEYDGRKLTLSQWSKVTGINQQTIGLRYRKKLPPSEILRKSTSK
jgi:hypothetical protein